MILSIETATPVCSVALGDPDGTIDERREVGKGIHSEKLFLFIEELMQEHQVEAKQLTEILISGGPGSYTGLRIGASAVKGLLFQSVISLQVLGTLESMAVRAIIDHPGVRKVHAVIDARRQHLYHQSFTMQNGQIHQSEPGVRPIELLNSEIQTGEIVIGTGIDRLGRSIRKSLQQEELYLDESFVSAVNLLKAYEHDHFKSRFKKVDPEQYEPEYLSIGQVNDSRYPAG